MHVVDKRNRPVGKVVKIFGPVKEPFAAVRPNTKVPLSVLGSDVYVSEGNDADTKGRRDRRSH
jgi:RNA-binding protein